MSHWSRYWKKLLRTIKQITHLNTMWDSEMKTILILQYERKSAKKYFWNSSIYLKKQVFGAKFSMDLLKLWFKREKIREALRPSARRPHINPISFRLNKVMIREFQFYSYQSFLYFYYFKVLSILTYKWKPVSEIV